MPCSYKGCDLPVIPGETTCFGHAPIERKALADKPFYDEFIDLLLLGREKFDGFIFPGEFSLASVHFNQPLSFAKSEFAGHCNFNGVMFPSTADFDDAIFRQGLDMRETHFKGRASFKRAEFYPSPDPNTQASIYCLDATGAHFNDLVEFLGAKFFDGDISFVSTFFDKEVNFRGSNFQVRPGSEVGGATMEFNEAHFSGASANLSEMTLEKAGLEIAHAVFGKCRVSFNSTKITKGSLQICFCEFEQCREVSLKRLKLEDSNMFLTDSNLESSNLSFQGCELSNSEIHLQNCAIHESMLDFSDFKLEGGELSLSGLNVSKSNLFFRDARLKGRAFEFSNVRMKDGEIADFAGAHFECEINEFSDCRLETDSISFGRTHFWFKSRFKEVDFRADKISFAGASFLGDVTNLDDCKFFGDVSFQDNDLANKVEFTDIRFSDQAAFRFTAPTFQSTSEEGIAPVIVFRRVKFNPYLTFFENIRVGTNYEKKTSNCRPLIAFRFSLLTDVYFSNNDMSLFSFYTAAYFEDSFFTLINPRKHRCEKIFPSILWIPFINKHYNRHYLIREEEDFLANSNKPVANSYHSIEMPEGADEIAELYLRMKSSADKAKDYHRASWYYFSEFDMKRRALREATSTKGLLGRIVRYPQHLLYDVYKLVAGYGEKPAWSVSWFFGVTIVFAFFHVFNGLKLKDTQEVINYDWCLPWNWTGEFHLWRFLSDLCTGAVFAVSRTLPLNYLPGTTMNITLADSTNWSFILSAINSVVLILLVVFIGVGFKRHFRRF